MDSDERDVFKHNSFCYFVLKANARENIHARYRFTLSAGYDTYLDSCLIS